MPIINTLEQVRAEAATRGPKLNDDDATEIRVIFHSGQAKMQEIAKMFGVSLSAVRAVVYRFTFRHLPLVSGEAANQ